MLLIHSQILKKGNFIGVSSKIRIALIQDPEQLQEGSQKNSIEESISKGEIPSCDSDKIESSPRC